MEEKHKDLIVTKRKALLFDIVNEISQTHGDFYYRPTGDIAFEIEKHIKASKKLSVEQREILAPLSRRDIQLLLSLQSSNCC